MGVSKGLYIEKEGKEKIYIWTNVVQYESFLPVSEKGTTPY